MDTVRSILGKMPDCVCGLRHDRTLQLKGEIILKTGTHCNHNRVAYFDRNGKYKFSIYIELNNTCQHVQTNAFNGCNRFLSWKKELMEESVKFEEEVEEIYEILSNVGSDSRILVQSVMALSRITTTKSIDYYSLIQILINKGKLFVENKNNNLVIVESASN